MGCELRVRGKPPPISGDCSQLFCHYPSLEREILTVLKAELHAHLIKFTLRLSQSLIRGASRSTFQDRQRQLHSLIQNAGQEFRQKIEAIAQLFHFSALKDTNS
jgi:hypothetical protein